MARLTVRLFGQFQVFLDDEPVTAFESNKARALLAYLAVEAHRPHHRDALSGLLWPDQPERAAHRNLSQALFNVRQALRDEQAHPPFFHVTRGTVQFNPDGPYWVDAAVLSRHKKTVPPHPDSHSLHRRHVTTKENLVSARRRGSPPPSR